MSTSPSPTAVVSEAKTPLEDCEIPGIDSALVSALRDPRERLPLFRLEKALVEWMQEGDGEWIEVGGPFNSRICKQQQQTEVPNNDMIRPGSSTSFQRCVLHRLADRFGIIREQGSSVDMIRLIRLPDSQIPHDLLQDLDPSTYSTTTENEVKIKPRKMKIMKRSNKLSNCQGQQVQDGHKGTKQSVMDKEKAYAEARARIFQESETDELNSADATLDVITQGLANFNTNEAALQRQPSRNSTGSVSSNASSNININNSNKTKAVYRNYAEEVADPDFQRSTVSRVANSSSLMASAPAWRPMNGN